MLQLMKPLINTADHFINRITIQILVSLPITFPLRFSIFIIAHDKDFPLCIHK